MGECVLVEVVPETGAVVTVGCGFASEVDVVLGEAEGAVELVVDDAVVRARWSAR